MADACIKAGDLVSKCGTPELQAAMRMVLRILGRNVAQRHNVDIIDLIDARHRMEVAVEDKA